MHAFPSSNVHVCINTHFTNTYTAAQEILHEYTQRHFMSVVCNKLNVYHLKTMTELLHKFFVCKCTQAMDLGTATKAGTMCPLLL